MLLKVQNGYYSNNFTYLHGDIVYVIFPGQMVVNQNTYMICLIVIRAVTIIVIFVHIFSLTVDKCCRHFSLGMKSSSSDSEIELFIPLRMKKRTNQK